ncbi:hypothetical protein EDB85DRAFT_1877610, partial [Lactarius pseudohatsudake]
ETRLTIPGIYYIIDPGFAKQNAYDPCLGMNSLVVLPVSQAQVRQCSRINNLLSFDFRTPRSNVKQIYWFRLHSIYTSYLLPGCWTPSCIGVAIFRVWGCVGVTLGG